MEVQLKSLEKRYGSVFAVKNLNLTIRSGALHFFLGPSGCGKTTTLRMLAGLEKPTGGSILFDGKDVTSQPAAERGIGMVFQNYALWPHMTVKKNIEYGLKLKKIANAEVQRRIKDVVDITQLRGYEDRFPGQLSGGQQQRVALARALAVRPNVLLLDEPLSNLDAKLRLEMRDNISRIHRETGITTIYVTHDQKEALSMGTDVSVMRKGILEQTAAPRVLYHHPHSSFIASFIGETNLLIGEIKEVTSHRTVIATELGHIQAGSNPFAVAVGEKAHISIRPEALVVDFGNGLNDVENQFLLTLDHLTYLGESEQFMFHAENGAQLRGNVFHTPEHALREGMRIKVGVAASDVLVLPHQSTTSET